MSCYEHENISSNLIHVNCFIYTVKYLVVLYIY